MARISAEEKERKKQALDEAIFSLFMNEGWKSVTYDRLAKEFGVSKSSIQNYYPSNIMFATALQGRVFPMVVSLLDFSSERDFVTSWMKAYECEDSHVFKDVVQMLLDNILKDGTSPYSRSGVLKLQQVLAKSIGEEAAEGAIKKVFGEVIYRKMFD